MNLHTDQATLDHWRTTGTWVMFGEGDRCPELGCDRYSQHTHPPDWMVEAAKPCETCDPKNWDGDPAMIEHLHQHGVLRDAPLAETGYPCCLDGRQRHTITVPCETCDGRGFVVPSHAPWENVEERTPVRCPDCVRYHFGAERIGVIPVPELAVVEWGPLVTVRPGIDIHNLPIDCIALTKLGLVLHIVGQRPVKVADYPPDIDPQSLVGQYAIGGRLVSASS